MIEQTKSRLRKSGDNGLVEAKNAAIGRKHIGWGHIGPTMTHPSTRSIRASSTGTSNYHRPSAQAEVQIDLKGRKRGLDKLWQTQVEKLLSLERPQQFLRPGLSVAAFKRVAASTGNL